MGALDCVSNKLTTTESTEIFTVKMNSDSSLNVPRRDVESQLLKPESSCRRHSLWWTAAIDLPLLILVLAVAGLFELGVIPQHKSGFFCNDPALSFAFTGDTVSMEVIMSTLLIFPIILIFATEFVFMDSTYPVNTKLHQACRKTACLYRNFCYGLFFNFGLIEVMKGISGNPRPTFFDICEPDTAKTCNGSEYVSTFECTSTRFSSWFQNDSYHSFPSGHTSLSVYCGLFMAWYLQQRAFSWRHRTHFVVPVLQLLCLTYAVVCSLTRITDHRHHWWDVLTGAVIGVVCALYTILVLSDNFSRPRRIMDKDVAVSQSVRTFVSDGQQSGVV